MGGRGLHILLSPPCDQPSSNTRETGCCLCPLRVLYWACAFLSLAQGAVSATVATLKHSGDGTLSSVPPKGDRVVDSRLPV